MLFAPNAIVPPVILISEAKGVEMVNVPLPVFTNGPVLTRLAVIDAVPDVVSIA